MSPSLLPQALLRSGLILRTGYTVCMPGEVSFRLSAGYVYIKNLWKRYQ